MSVSASLKKIDRKAVKLKIQRFGRFLSKMVMPNIAAFMAWGLLTACFHPNGWFPNEKIFLMVKPMVTYMLPMLIGYSGGKSIAGDRGGVVGAVATMGVISGTNIPMFMGAMMIGPFSGYIVKRVDQRLKEQTPVGFEMLVSNFSAGIVAAIIATLGYLIVGPVVEFLSMGLEAGVYVLVRHNLLFLVSLLIEPGKILFLNNAINHGVLSSLGLQQANETGKSIFFLLESNPGPGLGILIACYLHSRNSVKQTVPSAMVIHFLGGIHEIYFPYVLASPLLFIAVIAGGMSGVLTMNILQVGLVGMPSPGSVFAILALTPPSDMLAVIFSITVSTLVTLTVAKVLLNRIEPFEVEELEEIVSQEPIAKDEPRVMYAFENMNKAIRHIVFACDTGMGSSAMGAALLTKLAQDNQVQVLIENTAIDEIPSYTDLVITFEELKPRAEYFAPNAIHIGIHDFLYRPQYEALIEKIKPYCKEKEGSYAMSTPTEILMRSNIILGQASESKDEAINRAGRLLFEAGYVEEAYIEGMHAREAKFTTYIGSSVAIPHGENEVKDKIIASGLVVIQYPEGVDFGSGNVAKLVIGIAGKGNEHIQLLSNIAEAIEDAPLLEKLLTTTDAEYFFKLLNA